MKPLSSGKGKTALLSFEAGPAAGIFQMLLLKGYEKLQCEELYDVGWKAGETLVWLRKDNFDKQVNLGYTFTVTQCNK